MSHELHLSAMTSVVAEEMNVALDSVLELTMTALLYADRVTLVSPALLTAEKFGRAESWERHDILDFTAASVLETALQAAASQVGDLSSFEAWQLGMQLAASGRVPGLPPELLMWAVRRREEGSTPGDMMIEAKLVNDFRSGDIARRMMSVCESFLGKMAAAEASGLVTLRRPAVSLLPSPKGLEPLIAAVREELEGDAFLAVDAGIALIAGLEPEPRSGRGGTVPLQQVSFAHLPGFATSELDEVLQLRSEAADGLAAFRTSVVEFSTAMSDAPTDSAFAAEVEAAYNRVLAPTVDGLLADLAGSRLATAISGRSTGVGTPGQIRHGHSGGLRLGAVLDPVALGDAVSAAYEPPQQRTEREGDGTEQTRPPHSNRVFFSAVGARS